LRKLKWLQIDMFSKMASYFDDQYHNKSGFICLGFKFGLCTLG